MRAIYLGDVVGRAGRDAVATHLPTLRAQLNPDFIAVNGESAAGGFGITQKICEQFFALGVDCVTTGNHVWDQSETVSHIEREPRLLRPANFPSGTPGKGAAVFTTRTGRKVLVIQVMGRVFMDPLDDPFQALEAMLGDLQRLSRFPALVNGLTDTEERAGYLEPTLRTTLERSGSLLDRKSTRLNSSHVSEFRMPSSA